jgi:PAS domain S-box-containing protein
VADKDDRHAQAAELRRRAEEIHRGKAPLSPENSEILSPEEMRRTLHELHVHQIELEIQNEELRRSQEELDAARERYFDLYDLAPVGYCTLSEKGLILEANFTAATLLGVARGALVKQPISRFIHKEDQVIYYLHRKKLFETGEPKACELRMLKKDGTAFWVRLEATAVQDAAGVPACRVLLSDITERKQAGDVLRESEATVRKKLNAILEPEGDIGVLNLADVLDHQALQTMMEEFYRLTHIGISILDVHGKALVAVGWQDVCTKYHRVHPDTLNNCRESDLFLANGVPAGRSKDYRCKNNLWNMATPIEMGGRQLGSIYIGQFFYEDEIPDYELFRSQARQHGFDETEYLAALDRVPRWSRETVDAAMAFYSKLAGLISSLSYSTVKLSRALSQKDLALRLLGESEQRHRNILQTAMDGFWIMDMQGRLLKVNEAYCRMSGYSEQELLAMNISDLEDGKPPADTAARILERIAHGEDRFESRHLRKDGSIVNIEVSVQYRPIESGRFVVFLRDITDRKHEEEVKAQLEAQFRQAQKMESVGRLAGGVAHDFNNMLGVILGNVELAMEQVDPTQPLYADLEEIRKAANRSADLTRQLLAFARKQTVAPKVLDLNETVTGMLKMLRRLIGEDIHLSWKPGTGLWPVKMDPSQIDQILANLCVNARDAISGVGKMTIETGNSDCDETYCAAHAGFVPGDYVLLAISDNGCGMDRETLSHLFEPFFTTKAIGKGTGLGLATVYGIIKQNNGFINVYSEPGQGTTFKIYLPRHDGKSQLPTKGPQEAAGRGQETILLAEDEPAILEMTTRMLECQGYTVLAAGTPDEAIRLAREYAAEIHLLMTDVVMPEMNGRDLARNLLTSRPHIKRLFMSGYTANVIAHHGMLDAEVCFIQKPFSIRGLAAKVREALDRE